MQLQKAAHPIFVQLIDSVKQLSDDQYCQPCSSLSGNRVGQHVRHIIELFQSLEKGYSVGHVNYERRNRDPEIEMNRELACELLKAIFERLERENKDLVLMANFNEHSDQYLEIGTNYYREIAYNLEHAIHHMALMRVGITEISNIRLSKNFGMAVSTIKHQKKCAQ